ncbi:MAG UNVERIFIED_CONTAM: hypothetical protein LVR18_35000 [Planctomycetaceae bacterium]|jgi:diacylglycerol kinase family enzyme
MGTENLLAKYLGTRRCGRSLAGVIAEGRVLRLDSATANGRRVLLMVSCGPDADVVSDVHRRRVGHILRWSYVFPVLRALLWSGQRRFEVRAAELSAPACGSHVIISNVPRYGFEIPFAPEALPDDGLLDVRVYRGSGRWVLLWHLLRLKLGLPTGEWETTRFRTTSVSVYELDGVLELNFRRTEIRAGVFRCRCVWSLVHCVCCPAGDGAAELPSVSEGVVYSRRYPG